MSADETMGRREIGPVDKVPFTIDHLLAHLQPVDKVPFTIDHLLAHLQIEADFVVDRVVVTRGQRLVLRDLLQRAHDEIARLNDECEALRIDLAAAYCRMDDMEGYNDD